MSSAAEALFPGGPSSDLGNESPEKVLGGFGGNHEGALVWGEQKHRDAYLKMYGYERTLGALEGMLKNNRHFENQDNDQGKWWQDLKKYHDQLLADQSS